MTETNALGNRSHATRAQGIEVREVLIGGVFNDLTVISIARKVGSRQMVECRCVCGNIKVVRLHHLVSGASKSCGCLTARRNKARSVHGYAGRGSTRRREYRSWADAKKRCNNPNATHYECYGGRGITMCERWASSFEAFLQDIGDCPDGMTLDRINTDGNYEPGNCRWVSISEQARNRRSSFFVEYDGKRITLAGLAELLGVSYKALHYEHRVKNLPLCDAVERAKSRLVGAK